MFYIIKVNLQPTRAFIYFVYNDNDCNGKIFLKKRKHGIEFNVVAVVYEGLFYFSFSEYDIQRLCCFYT